MTRGMDWATLVSSLIAFAVYCNTWDSGFVYDDNRAILSNDDVLPQTPVLDLLRHDFWGTPLDHSGSHGSYRPLAVLSFRLNVALAGGRSARGFHVFNTLLHAAVTAAFTRWARLLTRHRVTPWISGVFFAVHPIHSEAVAGVVGRADVGAALFFMLALLAYHEHAVRGDIKFLIATLFLGACAMFTKEQGITVFAVCIIYELLAQPTGGPITNISFLFRRPQKRSLQDKRKLSSLLSLVSVSFLLIGLRTWLTGGNFPTFAAADNPASRSESLLTRTLTFFYLPAFNFGLLLCPSILSFDWSMNSIPLITSVFDVRNITTIVFYCALVGSICASVVRLNSIPGQEVPVKGLEKSLDVNSNVSNCDQKLHNRPKVLTSHQTLPTNLFYNHISKFCTCFPYLFSSKYLNKKKLTQFKSDSNSTHCQCTTNLGRPRSPSKTCCADLHRRKDCVIVLMCVSIMVTSFLPASNLVAYVGFVVAERILYIPSLGFCLLFGHGFTVILERTWKGNLQNKFVKIILVFMLILGFFTLTLKTILRNGDWKSEETLYRSGISVNPAKAYGNLGNILSMKGQYDEAERCYRKALVYRPNMADVHYNLGVLLQSQQRFEEALHRYRVAIQFRPRLAVAHLNLGLVLGRMARVPEAKTILRSCSELDGRGLRDPRTHEAARVACLFHLGRLSMEQGQLQEAVDVFHEAVSIRPHFYAPQSLFNMLGEAYSRMGRDADAEPWFRASLSTRPDHVPAHLTYGKLLARNRTRVGEAEDWYIRAERLAPGDAAVFRHYGQFLLAQKRYGEAATKLEHAISLSSSPEFEDVVSAATSLRLAGDFASAEKYYKLAITLRPQEASSMANLGALYHLTGRLDEAEVYYQETLKLLPNDDVTKMNLKRLRNLKITEEEKQKLQGK